MRKLAISFAIAALLALGSATAAFAGPGTGCCF
jgi:hypothetical protein